MNSTSTVLWEPGRATVPATRQAEVGVADRSGAPTACALSGRGAIVPLGRVTRYERIRPRPPGRSAGQQAYLRGFRVQTMSMYGRLQPEARLSS